MRKQAELGFQSSVLSCCTIHTNTELLYQCCQKSGRKNYSVLHYRQFRRQKINEMIQYLQTFFS